MQHFADNLERLIGLHGSTHRETARVLGLSVNTLAKWKAGDRAPSFPIAMRVAEFFGVPPDRLANAAFEDLLEHELADPVRFKATEKRFQKARSGLKSV